MPLKLLSLYTPLGYPWTQSSVINLTVAISPCPVAAYHRGRFRCISQWIVSELAIGSIYPCSLSRRRFSPYQIMESAGWLAVAGCPLRWCQGRWIAHYEEGIGDEMQALLFFYIRQA